MVKEIVQEEDNFEVTDNMDALASMVSKKRNLGSKKERERKILDFKFRALELLEIFITKSSNSHTFVQSLPKLFLEVKQQS
jgi:hypothetical protein